VTAASTGGKSAPARPRRRSRRSFTQLTWDQDAAEQRAEFERAATGDGDGNAFDRAMPKGMGYEVLSYLVAGPLAYGGLGWLIGHYTHISVLFPIGMLVGLAISTGWVIYRYGVKGDRYGVPANDDQPAGREQEQKRREETCR
jgi:F0F1-type ATP synthase assembly protein I